ncbi:MAG: sigma-E factor negative regulatory protein [Nitrosomonadales bacterium]|nr:sigma-E factor negative regulatory protein [Nitrosomonadales bacterium]
MKQEISALMDGELFEDEAENLLGRIKRDSDAHGDWEIYHLIGDVLRQPEHVHCDLSAKVRKRMQDEPIVLAPHGRAVKQKMRTVALSAAASLAAVGVVAWMSLQIGHETVPQMAMKQPVLRPASAQIRPKANDYLMAHHEFSPRIIDMSGGASYIHTIAYTNNEK